MPLEKNHFYRFGSYRLDPAKRELLRGQKPVPLMPKAFDTLLVLVENNDRVVEKDELMKVLWPDSFVEEANLAQNVAVLRKALGDSPDLHRYIMTIPGRGYRFAAKVSEVSEPGASDLVVERHSRSRVLIQERKSPNTLIWAAATVIVLAAFSAVAYRWTEARRPREKTAANSGAAIQHAPVRRSVAVLGFQNLTKRPEDAWLSTALSEMLSTELAAGEQLRMVPGEDVARLRTDMPLSDSDTLSRDTLSRMHKSLNADYVVLGSFTALGVKRGNRIRLDLRLQDAVAGETIASVADTGKESDLFELISQAGAQLRQKLGAGEVSLADVASARAASPSNAEATRLYAEGLAKLRVFEAISARDLLVKAIAADPNYPLAHSALADAWTALGYDSKAREEAKRAFELSSKLSREERLSVKARYRESTLEWDKAAEIHKSLFTFFPDNLDYGLRLAQAQIYASKGHDALATLGRLRQLPPPGRDDPRIDLKEARAWESLGEYTPELQPLSRAAENARAHGERLVLSAALLQTAFVLGYLGDQSRAEDMGREAGQIYAAVGDRQGEANALRALGDAVAGSDPPGAILFYRQALAIERNIGQITGQAAALNEMAIQYSIQGDHATAMRLYLDAYGIYRQVDDKARATALMGNVASELMLQGQLAESAQMYERTLKSAQDLENKGAQANALYNSGAIQALRGDLLGARGRLQQALSIWRETDDKFDSTYALSSLGEIAMAQDDLAGARKMFDDSLALRQGTQQEVAAGENRLGLAELGLEEGRPASEAEAIARQAIQLFHNAKVADDEAMADTLLARALLMEGKSAEATRAIDQATGISSRGQDPSYRMLVAVASARIHAVADENGAARIIQTLKSTIAAARKMGYVGIELEARLALGEIDTKSGKTAEGRTVLTELEKDARAKDFGLIARKAAAARSGKKAA